MVNDSNIILQEVFTVIELPLIKFIHERIIQQNHFLLTLNNSTYFYMYRECVDVTKTKKSVPMDFVQLCVAYDLIRLEDSRCNVFYSDISLTDLTETLPTSLLYHCL